METDMGKSNSSEDYMKSILILQKKRGTVRSVDVAEEMGVSRPSVSNAMKKLREEKLINFGEEGHISFTAEGKRFAEMVYEKHLLLSKLLTIIGVNKDTADREACLMEHAISDETYRCLNRFIKAYGREGKAVT